MTYSEPDRLGWRLIVVCAAIFATLAFTTYVFSDEPEVGFLGLSQQWTNEGVSAQQINSGVMLPGNMMSTQQLQMFGVMGDSYDLGTFDLEVDLCGPVYEDLPISWCVEFADTTFGNEVFRSGIHTSLNDLDPWHLLDAAKIKHSTSLFFHETDGTGMHFENTYLVMLTDRLYFRGFAELDWDTGMKTTMWRLDNQFGFRLFDGFHVVAGHYQDDTFPVNDGFRYGVEYIVNFNR